MSGAGGVDRKAGRRRRWVLPAGLAVLLLVVHGAVWFVVTGRMLEAVPGFVSEARRAGWALASETPRRAGWPWDARVRVPALVATRELGGTAFVAAAEQVDLVIRPGEPGVLLIRPGGSGTVRFGAGAPVDVRAERAELRVPLDGAGAAELVVAGLVLGHAQAGVSVARVEARIDTGVVAGRAGPVVLSPPFPAPFDGGATLSGRVVVVPPMPAAATPGQSAAAWRDAGGRASLPELVLDWGRLRVEGTVAGGLDGGLQPFGDAQLRVTGALEVLDAASRAGAIQPGPAAAARAVLSLLTLAAKGGPVAVPVVLRDGVLSVAQFALTRVPVVAW